MALIQTNRREFPLKNKADDQTQRVDHQRVQTKQSPPSRLDRWKRTKHQSYGSQKFAKNMDHGAGWEERKKGQSETKGWARATGSKPATEQTGISVAHSSLV